MTETNTYKKLHSPGDETQSIKNLTLQQIHMIDEAIASVGEFGEVHLVVEKSRLRFVVTKTSHDALTYEKGAFKKED